VPTPHLNGHHTIFGQCDETSVELVMKIARVPTDPGDKPKTPVRINKLVIERGAPKSAPSAEVRKPAKPQAHYPSTCSSLDKARVARSSG